MCNRNAIALREVIYTLSVPRVDPFKERACLSFFKRSVWSFLKNSMAVVAGEQLQSVTSNSSGAQQSL